MNQIIKPKKRDAHIQLSRRFQKAIQAKDSVKFLQIGIAFVPSAKEMPDKGHYVNFGDKPYCECTSFTMGYSNDLNFTCYHIIAARMKWLEITSKDTRKSLNGYKGEKYS